MTQTFLIEINLEFLSLIPWTLMVWTEACVPALMALVCIPGACVPEQLILCSSHVRQEDKEQSPGDKIPELSAIDRAVSWISLFNIFVFTTQASFQKNQVCVPCHITTNGYCFKVHTLSSGKDLKQHVVITCSPAVHLSLKLIFIGV